MTITWTLDRSAPAPAAAPGLDADQARVVAHRRGPLLVLAGPGTGKTTTIVEATLARLSDPADPVAPDEILVLTFGRRAAGELRSRILRRSGGGPVPHVATFHSFAYGLMRQLSDPLLFSSPARLLSGPEQQQRIRELLLGDIADGRLPWPAEFREAVRTRGFAEQVRALIAAVRGQGLEGTDLAWLGRAEGRAAWEAAGEFVEQYLQVAELEGVLDYTEVLLQAAVAAERDPSTRTRYRAVYVDEYQDTDPLQVRLLRALVTPETTLVAVGDPDQSIYAFRGADVGCLLRFRDEFRAPDGGRAPVAVLGASRRFGPAIRVAASRVLGDGVPPHLERDDILRLRHSGCHPDAPSSEVDVVVCDDARIEAEFIADLLRRAALDPDRPIPWSQMAVVVRSGTRQIPALRRALVAAGVPVEVAGDELPVAREPAAAPLLLAASVVADPARLTPEVAEALLTSPLGGVDPADLRQLSRALRRRERARLAAESRAVPPSSGEVLASLLVDPSPLDALPAGPLAEVGESVRRLADLLERAGVLMRAGATPVEVLWALWSGTGWPRRLRRAALGAGMAARRAHADLDAVLALFDEADRAVQRRSGFAGLEVFVEELTAQEIPARSLRESAVGREAVRLLTAHRAKGLEWRLVVVAGVQEGAWPDLRWRDTLLGAESVRADGGGGPTVVPPTTPAELLAEERRLFYVACTRARERLVVTAVASPDEDGAQPSRLLDQLGVPARQVGPSARSAPGSRGLSLPALVGDLRRALADPATAPEVRAAAADRLALLAGAVTPDGRPIAPSAHPRTWWATRDLTDPGVPLRDPDQPVALSGTGIELLGSCALRWFLEREVRAQTASGTSAGFGLVVHAVADLVGRGLIPADPASVDAAVDRVWDALPFEARWRSESERDRAREMLARFLHWHAGRDRELVGTEVEFDVVVPVRAPDGAADAVRLRGSMDVVEAEVRADAIGVRVADLKTGTAPAAKDVADHVQLGVYQVAVREGAAAEALAAAGHAADLPVVPEGAAVIALRDASGKGQPGPKVLEQPPLVPGDAEGPDAVIAAAARTVRAEDFAATPGKVCEYCAFSSMCPAQPEGQGVAR